MGIRTEARSSHQCAQPFFAVFAKAKAIGSDRLAELLILIFPFLIVPSSVAKLSSLCR